MADVKSLQKELTDLLGDANVISSAEEISGYFQPATKAPGLIAVKPGKVEDVQTRH